MDYEKGLYDKALVHFLRADKFESGENNPKLKGLINRGIGDCLSNYYDITSAIEYHKSSYEWFNKAAEPLYAIYAMVDIAYKYRSLHNDSLVNKYCQNIEKYAIDHSNQDLFTCSLLARGDVLVSNGRYKEAVKIYDRIPDLNSPEITEDNYMKMGTAYLIEGNVQKAMELNKKVITLEPAMNGIVLNMMAREKKYKALSDTLIHAMAILDSVRNTVWTRNNIATINEYYRSEDEKNEAIAASMRNRNWIIAISGLLLVIVVMSIYFLRTSYLKKTLYKTLSEADSLRRLVNEKDDFLTSADRQLLEKNESIEHLNRDVHSLCDDICGLNQDIDRLQNDNSMLNDSNLDLENRLQKSIFKEMEMETAINRMQQEVHKVLISRYHQIDNLLRDYNEAEGSKSEHEKVFLNVKNLVEDFKSNPDVIFDMESIINANLGNLIDCFRKDFPRLRETNINLLIFLVLGISNATIAILQSSTIDTVYSRKSKLRKILTDSDHPNAPTYLKYIS